MIGPGRPGPLVAVDVGPVVGKNHVLVPVEERGDDRLGGVAVTAGEDPRGEGVDGCREFGSVKNLV
jgi:hypothetical protein